MAGALLVSFSSREIDAVDGIWTGAYRSDNVREKVLVKFESENHMELYNGTVAVESAIGQGTKFTVTLPAKALINIKK